MANHPRAGKLAVILHADVVDSTALVQQDEHLTHEGIQATFRRFKDAISQHDGRVCELRGDALLAEFERASDAVAAALAFQSDQAKRNARIHDPIRPAVRVGIAMGEVILADDTVTGAGVVLAQRLEQLATPGGVCLQDAVYQTLPKRLPFAYESFGEHELKGFSEKVKVYGVKLTSGSEIPRLPDHDQMDQEQTPSLAKPSIAVLAFENMSGDREQEFFADGISEDLITALSKIRWFFVIDRNSCFSYKGKTTKATQIAKELNVRYVLEGSVRKVSNRVRITAQLVDATSGKHVWAERYDRDIENIFELQDEMTLTIVSAVDSEVGAAERERALRKPPESLDVWETYQRGLWHLWRFRPDDVNKALRLFESASKLDPGFVPAFAYEAYAHYVNVIQGYVSDVQGSLDRAFGAASTAVSLDPRDAVAHFALGRVYTMRGEHDNAIASLKESVMLNPSLAQAHHGLGWALLLSGDLDEAVNELLKAIQLSPRDPRVWATMVFLSLAHCLKKDYEEAAEWALNAARIPTDAGYWSSATLAAALANMNRTEEAKDSLQSALRKKPDLSLSYLRNTLPTRDSTILEPYLDGLRMAGLTDDHPSD